MLGSLKLDTTPAGVIRPIELFARLVNQRLPSGPATIAVGVMPRKVVTVPTGLLLQDGATKLNAHNTTANLAKARDRKDAQLDIRARAAAVLERRRCVDRRLFVVMAPPVLHLMGLVLKRECSERRPNGPNNTS